MTPRVVRTVERKYELIPTPRPIRVCAYVRVSTRCIEQQNSLQNQTGYYADRFIGLPQYVFIGIFSDSGISGAKDARPGFQAMLKKARAGEIDLIYTKSISRFARNTLTLLKAVRELRELGVGIIFEEQGINTLHQDGELMLSVLGSIAEEERKSVSGNIRWSKRNGFRSGRHQFSLNQLFGYTKDEQGNVVIAEAEAQVVREIYRRYLNSDSCSIIAKAFRDEAVPTFGMRPWGKTQINSILVNEKYRGDILMQKTFVSENGIFRRNHGELAKYYMEDNHPAIIERSDWDAVRKIRLERANRFDFSRQLKCPYCGASLVRAKNRYRWVYWICGTKLEYTKAACKGINVPEQIIIELNKVTPITEPMVVLEVSHDEPSRKRPKKDYRLVPVKEYAVFTRKR